MWIKRLVIIFVCLGVLITGILYGTHRYLLAKNLFYIVSYMGYPVLKLGDLPEATPAWPIDSFTYENQEINGSGKFLPVMIPKYSNTIALLGEDKGNISGQIRETNEDRQYHWNKQTGYYRFCEKDLIKQTEMDNSKQNIYDKYNLQFVSENNRGIFGAESLKNFRNDFEINNQMKGSVQEVVAKVYLQSDKPDKNGLYTPLAVVLFDKRGDCIPLGSL